MAEATLTSISKTGTYRWMVTFDVDGALFAFDVQGNDVESGEDSFPEVVTIIDGFEGVDDDDDDGEREELLGAVVDELLGSGLFGPIYGPNTVRDSDFDEDVTGASMIDTLFFLDPGLAGRELFDTLFAHALARVEFIEDISDFAEVTSVTEELWLVANMMERVMVNDRPRRFVDALRRFCTVLQDVDADDEGWRVLPESIADIESAKARLLGAN